MTESREYCFLCNHDGHGEIYDRDSLKLWSFRSGYRGKPPSVFALLPRLPDFSFCDTAGKELFAVSCRRRLPLDQFDMWEKGKPSGALRQRSFLRTKYAFDFADGTSWTFRMPLFTAYFSGVSSTGVSFQARLYRHDTWYVQMPEGADTPRLLAALAFIQRERQRVA
jgi:hypothetical protein